MFDEEFADAQPYDVLDATKLIPEEDVPVRIIGRMVLDRWPDNFFAETEQVAFLPSNIVPGIDFSNDPLLQGRLFSYLDTQKSRLGTTNFHQIPINAPKCPFQNFQRDGMMQTLVSEGPRQLRAQQPGRSGRRRRPARKSGDRASPASRGNVERNDPAAKLRMRAERFADHYSQARLFYRSQTAIEQAHIASAFVFELSKVELEHVRARVLANLRNVDEDLAQRVADGLAMPLPPALAAGARRRSTWSLRPRCRSSARAKPTLQGRKVGILFDEGLRARPTSNDVKADVEAAGGTALLIAPKVGGMKVKGGTLKADGQLAGTPSVLFDAVALVLTRDAATKLAKEGAAVEFVRDAFGHLKAIGCAADAAPLLQAAGVEPDAGRDRPRP